jgi:hypothetical protein
MGITCLSVCPECARHVRCGERACPFCGARVSSFMRVLEYRVLTRFDRSRLVSLGAALTAAGFAVGCYEGSGGPAYGIACTPMTCPSHGGLPAVAGAPSSGGGGVTPGGGTSSTAGSMSAAGSAPVGAGGTANEGGAMGHGGDGGAPFMADGGASGEGGTPGEAGGSGAGNDGGQGGSP